MSQVLWRVTSIGLTKATVSERYGPTPYPDDAVQSDREIVHRKSTQYVVLIDEPDTLVFHNQIRMFFYCKERSAK